MADFNQQMRDKLLAMQSEIASLAESADESAATVELDQSKVGRLSRMDALQAQAMAQASVERREQALRNIAVALQRIEDDEYGECVACDEPINPKR